MQALFSILGTTYGDDGRTTFGLPDLRGRAPIFEGSGPGLPTYRLGQKGGGVSSGGNVNAAEQGRANPVTAAAPLGGDRSPYLTINYIIALQGIFTSRS